MLDHLQSILNLQIITIEKALVSIDAHANSSSRNEIRVSIAKIQKIVFDLVNKMTNVGNHHNSTWY